MKNKISIIIACYQDSESIPEMYERILKVFSKISFDYEIIFVNDGSTDNSEEILTKICEKDKKVIAIFHSRNFGLDNAFSSGMKHSTGAAAVLLDGDMQDPPEMIPDFILKWQEGNEVVYGQRVDREGSRIMNFMYKLF